VRWKEIKERICCQTRSELFGWQLSGPMLRVQPEQKVPTVGTRIGETVSGNCRRNLLKESASQSFFSFPEDSRGRMSCFCFIKSSGESKETQE